MTRKFSLPRKCVIMSTKFVIMWANYEGGLRGKNTNPTNRYANEKIKAVGATGG